MTASLQPHPATPPPHPGATSRSLRILYADDLRDLRILMQLVLARDGHSVEVFPDASQALPRIESVQGDFDLVITDHHMPEMNGLEFVGHLRRIRYPGRIIVFSSELAPEVREAYCALQVDHVLPKPVLPAELRCVLAQLFPAPTVSS